jgi:hypothetical protein
VKLVSGNVTEKQVEDKTVIGTSTPADCAHRATPLLS